MYVIYTIGMKNEVISIRELQRNYRKLIDTVRHTKSPLFLGAHQKAEAVLVDVDVFEHLQQRAATKDQSWASIKKQLHRIRMNGKKTTNLAQFIHEDRQHH